MSQILLWQFILGFLGLLRGSEIFGLNIADCQLRGQDQVTLILRNTKGVQLRNVTIETVSIRDPLAIKIISKRQAEGVPRLYNAKPAHFAKLYKQAITYFQLSHPKPTPHGIRRGGRRGIFAGMGRLTAL